VTRLAPTGIAKWLGLAYAAGLAAFFLIGADAPDVVVLSLLFLPFYLGSAAAAAMLVKASRTRLGAWVFLAVEAVVVASTPGAFVWAKVMADRDLWTAAGASMFMAFVVPVYQYAAVLVVFVLAFLLGWRARDSWLKA
jgi:hypothetical protein